MADIYGYTVAATTFNGADTGLSPPEDDGLRERQIPEGLIPAGSLPVWYQLFLLHTQL